MAHEPHHAPREPRFSRQAIVIFIIVDVLVILAIIAAVIIWNSGGPAAPISPDPGTPQIDDLVPPTQLPEPQSAAPAPQGASPASEHARPLRAAGAYEVPAGRSPIPQPGETIVKPIAYRYVASPEMLEAEPGAVVNWGEAHRYLGQVITAEGTIVNTNNIGSVCFLNFSPNWREGFYVVIFKSCFDEFPQPPETLFLNQRVQITGKVTLHRNRPQIRVESAKQIEIVE